MKEVANYLEHVAKGIHSMIVGKYNQSTTTLCYNKLNKTLYAASKKDPLSLKDFAFGKVGDYKDVTKHKQL